MVSIETYLNAIKKVAYDWTLIRVGSFDSEEIDRRLKQLIVEIQTDAVKNFLYERATAPKK